MADRYVAKGTTNLGLLTINDNDRVIFAEGEQTITTGTDITTGHSLAEGLQALIFQRTAAIKVPAQSPLKVDIDNTASTSNPQLYYAQNTGEVWIQPSGDDNLIKRAKHIGRSSTLGFMGGGTLTTLEQRSGTSIVQSAVALTNLYLGGGSASLLYKSTNATLIDQAGGSLFSQRAPTTGYFHGGKAVFSLEDSSASLPTATLIRCDGNADVTWRLGDITTLYLLGPNAVFDISNIVANITIAAFIVDSLAMRNPRNKHLIASLFSATKTAVTVLYDESDSLA